MILDGKETFRDVIIAKAESLHVDPTFLLLVIRNILAGNTSGKDILITYGKFLVKDVRKDTTGKPGFNGPERITAESFSTCDPELLGEGILLPEILEDGEKFEVVHKAVWQFLVKEVQNIKKRYASQVNETTLVGIVEKLCEQEIKRLSEIDQVTQLTLSSN